VLDGRPETCTPAPVDGGESVGAGDAFAAALLVELVSGASLGEALATASQRGAAVAAAVRR
jgi:sugar/nucleoside kinase (ribokinase family)